MAVFALPVTNADPNYRFQIELEGRLYFFEFRYNTRMERWLMDLEDENQDPLVVGIPVLTNLFLLAQFVDDRLPPGFIIAQDESGEGKQATRQQLGNDVKLLYMTSDEAEGL